MNACKIVFTALALSAACSTASALPNLIVNGGFEADNFGGSYTTLSSGLTGWTIDYGSIDGIGGYWQAAEGKNSIDLFGNSRGQISQVINTVIDTEYTVSYYQAFNPDYTDDSRKLKLDISSDTPDSGPYLLTFNQDFNLSAIRSSSNMQWEFISTTFVAQGVLTTISFRGESTANNQLYGPALDGVVITGAAVPLPGVLGLMLAGLVGSGYSSKRREQSTAK